MPRLAQHFLKSSTVANRMVGAAEISIGESVLEIGPGRGMLTEALLRAGARVVAVEKDSSFIPFLEKKFADYIKTGAIKLERSDIRDIDLKKLKIKNSKFKIVSNIPYYITGELLRSFLSAEIQPSKIVFLVQKEVAERIVARGGKESILSISIRAYGDPKMAAKVHKKYFSPQPKVDSAILLIDNISRNFFQKLHHTPPNHISRTRTVQETEKLFFGLVKAGFSSKRKKLANNLKNIIENPICAARSCGVSANARAEDLSLEEWACLFLSV